MKIFAILWVIAAISFSLLGAETQFTLACVVISSVFAAAGILNKSILTAQSNQT